MNSALPEIHEEVLISLRQIMQAIDLHSKKISKQYGLTAPQLVVLNLIRKLQSPSVKKLADWANLSSATVSDVLDRLTQKGLIQRVRSEKDKRLILIHLTEKGIETLHKSPPLLQDQFLEKFSKLEKWEQTLIVSSLQRVADMMKATKFDASPILGVGAIAPETLKKDS